MEKRIALFIVCLIVVCLSGSVVIALPPMGPPKALLGQDRWEVGVEYGFGNMDLEAVSNVKENWENGFEQVRRVKHNINDLKSNIVLGRAGYGINDNWDAFVRLGVIDAKDDIEQIYPDGATPDKYNGFDGSFGLAWGLGTRATFWQDEILSWGGLFQIIWEKPDKSDISLAGDPEFSGTAEIEIWEVQIALGPTWRPVDSFCLYGGPFLHFVRGDLDISGETNIGFNVVTESSGDIEEKSQFGGYVGAYWDMDALTKGLPAINLELQLTGDAWGVGLGSVWKF
jgi:hypothetical protein